MSETIASCGNCSEPVNILGPEEVIQESQSQPELGGKLTWWMRYSCWVCGYMSSWRVDENGNALDLNFPDY
jgi:hypothetical protein